MPDAPASLYVAARSVLLDACDALGKHSAAMVLVGAQAVYLRAGDVDLDVVAPFTSDADLSIDPAQLDSTPAIQEAMSKAGFKLKVIMSVRSSASCYRLLAPLVLGRGSCR